MGTSKIEQLIEDIYEFVESCKMQPLSSTKVIVPKDELYDLLDELRLRTPEEIKRYQKIIANRDAILADAESKATTMLAEAQDKTNTLISDHEIMQQAYYQANEILEQANNEANRIMENANYEANQIQTSALAYTEEMLNEVEKLFSEAYEKSKSNCDSLLSVLKENLETISSNKKELCQQPEQTVPEEDNNDQDPEKFHEEEFAYDENTLMEEID